MRCRYCRRNIPEKVHPYTVRIEIFPRVEESLVIAEDRLESDLDDEIQKLVHLMESLGEEAVKLEEERVYSRFVFTVCPACRDRLAEDLRRAPA